MIFIFYGSKKFVNKTCQSVMLNYFFRIEFLFHHELFLQIYKIFVIFQFFLQYVLFVILLFMVQAGVSILTMRYKVDVSRKIHADLLRNIKQDIILNQQYIFHGNQMTWDLIQSAVSFHFHSVFSTKK